MSTQLSTGVKLVFRYWNCRGRVQAVRYMLEDIAYANKNVDYKDDPELLENAVESWFPKKSNEDYAGPYHSLPVLHWNDKHIFGQTLTIGLFNPIEFYIDIDLFCSTITCKKI